MPKALTNPMTTTAPAVDFDVRLSRAAYRNAARSVVRRWEHHAPLTEQLAALEVWEQLTGTAGAVALAHAREMAR